MGCPLPTRPRVMTLSHTHAGELASDLGGQKMTVRRRSIAVSVVAAFATLALAAPAEAAASGRATAGVKIRRCANSSCWADGTAYPSHRLTLICYVRGEWVGNTNIWYRLHNRTTGVRGYSTSRYVQAIDGYVPPC